MKKNKIFYKNHISEKLLDKSDLNKLSKKFNTVFSDITREIKNPKKTLNIINSNFSFNFNFNDLRRFRKFKEIAIIGMGGSILGAEAIYEFLKTKIKKKVYFFDDLDDRTILKFNRKNLNNILFLVISKSGNTTETLSNLFALKIIKKNSKNIITISENKDNLLNFLSSQFNLYNIHHKTHVGGRYSVLSEVGIIPLYLMGLNSLKFRSNIDSFLKNPKKSLLKNSSIKLACLLKKRKLNNLILLNYSPKIEKFLFWCQQLIAESLGKKGLGFLPMISNMPKDHHSLLQLYLDGPKDKFFYIFSSQNKNKNKINTSKIFKKNFYLNKKNLNEIKHFQKEALKKAFNKHKIPFKEFHINSHSEEVLGELFSYFILETILIAKLININPFDQPAVEQVKIYTKEFLN